MRICFTIHGRRYCFTIPLLIDPLWRLHIHGPGPVEGQAEGPQPQPWVTGEGKVTDWAKDLQILASVHALSHELSGEAQKVVHAALDQALARVKAQLPEGAEIHAEH
ncbi:MAG TPA: hypothetical protein VIE43_22695 [Thermoanaerobaculia bacterium]|jgi:hypothetical protein|nr:hypothetical protein [Thermoanaerobaculia bacterium]